VSNLPPTVTVLVVFCEDPEENAQVIRTRLDLQYAYSAIGN
jgi:hypothetical protein